MHTLKQWHKNSGSNVVSSSCKPVISNAEKLTDLAIVNITKKIMRPSGPKNVAGAARTARPTVQEGIGTGNNMQTLVEHKLTGITGNIMTPSSPKSRHGTVNVIGIIKRRCWPRDAISIGEVERLSLSGSKSNGRSVNHNSNNIGSHR